MSEQNEDLKQQNNEKNDRLNKDLEDSIQQIISADLDASNEVEVKNPAVSLLSKALNDSAEVDNASVESISEQDDILEMLQDMEKADSKDDEAEQGEENKTNEFGFEPKPFSSIKEGEILSQAISKVEEKEEKEENEEDEEDNLNSAASEDTETDDKGEKAGEKAGADAIVNGGAAAIAGTTAGFGMALHAIKSFAKSSSEQKEQKAIRKYADQNRKMDKLLESLQGNADDIANSHLGQVQKGFMDQGIEPPIDTMKSTFKLDKKSQKSWSKLQADLEEVESLALDMQKLSARTGKDQDKLNEKLMEKTEGVTDKVKEQLSGMVDGKGNKFSDKIDAITDRMKEMINNMVESIKSMLGASKGAALQSMSQQ